MQWRVHWQASVALQGVWVPEGRKAPRRDCGRMDPVEGKQERS